MRLSVIIISWNSRTLLEKCVESIDSLIKRADTELIWVDNGSIDNAYEMMSTLFPDSKLIRLDKNMGVAYARNRGIEASTGEYILILDDDTVASEDTIIKLVEYMDQNQSVGICGPSLWNENNLLQPSFKDYPGIGVKVSNVLRSFTKKEKVTHLPEAPFEPCYIIGACQLIRRKVIEECGMLDQHIFYGPEDADICIRARQKGWHIMYLPQLSIRHHWRRITNRNIFSKMARIHTYALFYFYFKHKRFW